MFAIITAAFEDRLLLFYMVVMTNMRADVMIRARVSSGMENVRAKGRRIGRPRLAKEDIPAAFLRHYPAYKAGALNVSELARVCGISRTTVYKYIGLLEE